MIEYIALLVKGDSSVRGNVTQWQKGNGTACGGRIETLRQSLHFDTPLIRAASNMFLKFS